MAHFSSLLLLLSFIFIPIVHPRSTKNVTKEEPPETPGSPSCIITGQKLNLIPPLDTKMTRNDLIKQDITIQEDNIYKPCFRQGYCFFLSGDDKNLEEENPSQSTAIRSKEKSVMICDDTPGKNVPCMRVNIKPLDYHMNTFRVEMALINPPYPHYWMGVAFRQKEYIMFNSYLAYCVFENTTNDGKFLHGVILGKKNSNDPVSVRQKHKEAWNEDPEDTKAYVDSHHPLAHCDFTTVSTLDHMSIDEQDQKVHMSKGDFFFLFAYGRKLNVHSKLEISRKKSADVVFLNERHCIRARRGHTMTRLNEVKTWISEATQSPKLSSRLLISLLLCSLMLF